MSQIKFSGSFKDRYKSFWMLNRIAIGTYARRAIDQKLAPDWDANTEIGIRFIRHQFTVAMQHSDIALGRQLFDRVQLETADVYEVIVEHCEMPRGTWYMPKNKKSNATLLYFHGGGYTFHGAVSKRFAAMLAHRIGARVFAADYRLTPEHPHPAQAEDALAAWEYILHDIPAEQIVVIGDSAGGHMSLMLLQTLREKSLAYPALCVGLCPWTDIGDRGRSLFENDATDLVQGWMALQFGEWLDPESKFGREQLSPISYDYAGLGPIYLQAGGREVLRDMIVDFAEQQKANGAEVEIDLWPDMPHVFQAYDTTQKSSREALARLSEIIAEKVS